MCPAIHNPTSCKILTVIHFFPAKNASSAEIHHELCTVYGQNVTSKGTVRQWCRMVKDGQKNVYNEERSGWSSVVSDLVQNVAEKIVKDGTSQFQNFRVYFHKFHVLFSTRSAQLV
jgi:hypothetical protein